MRNADKFKVIDGHFYRMCTCCKEFILVNEKNFYKDRKSSVGFSGRCRKCTTSIPSNIKAYLKGGVYVDWTSEFEKLFRELYPIMSNKEIAEKLNITERTARNLAEKLKIKKTSETRSRIQRNVQPKNRSEFYINYGVKYFHRPDHPYCKKDGTVAEHRLVMEEKLGRYLSPTEGVYHKNKDKTDNSYDNLELMTRLKPEVLPLDIYNDRKSGMEINEITAKYKISTGTYYDKYKKGKAMSENTNNK